jgi:hypothetical protein
MDEAVDSLKGVTDQELLCFVRSCGINCCT